MHSSRPMIALVLASGLAVSSVTPAAAQRTCGTVAPSQAQLDQLERDLASRGTASPLACSGAIMVAFHVLHDGPAGLLTQATVDAQIQELNNNYAGYGYSFVLGQTDFTDNPAWFNLQTSADESAMKAALAVYPAQTLNIYSCIPYGYLGFSYFPYSFPESSVEHGVFIDYRSVPGGSAFPYDLGRTATHEIGHYLGLFHTFQGGCAGSGDQVADTPAEATATFGCPDGKDTCGSPGLDPIHNYMDYSDDACYTEFTAGQAARMCLMVQTYRPSLISSGPTPARHEGWGKLKVRYR
jgi:Pregnancy-associated plasma protein-A